MYQLKCICSQKLFLPPRLLLECYLKVTVYTEKKTIIKIMKIPASYRIRNSFFFRRIEYLCFGCIEFDSNDKSLISTNWIVVKFTLILGTRMAWI